MLRYRWIPLFAFWLATAWNAQGQERAFTTDEAEILKTGWVRAEFAMEFLQGQSYSLSGLNGDLARLGVSSIQVGIGEYAEFEISGVARDILSVSSRAEQPPIPATFTGTSTNDVGDLILGTKIKFFRENGLRPAMTFKFAVELPNAKHDSGLGTDETEFYSTLLFKKSFGRSQVLADVGLAILGSPVLQGRQTDPLTYSVAAIVPLYRNINLVAEISGRQGPPNRLGNENKSQARAGIRFWTGKVRWDLGAVAGFMPYDPKSGIVVGATYEFQAFQRNQPPVTIK